MKQCIFLLFTFFTLVSFSQETTSFIGIGVRMQIDSISLPYLKVPKITELVPDGSAISSGLQVGDLIMYVDDQSTLNLPLSDIVKMITGEENTQVTIEVKRNEFTEKYVITRKRIMNTEKSNVSENADLCTSLTTILNDAPNHFNNVIDSTSSVGNGYPCKVKVPGAQNIVFKNFLGRTCYITFGTYKTENEANTAKENTINSLKSCFPQCYFFLFDDKNFQTVQIGISMEKGGYSSAMMSLYSYLNSDDGAYHLESQIDEGALKAFLPIEVPAPETEFALAIRKIYDDAKYDFGSTKGTQHESGGPFNTAYWYDLNFTIPGAARSYIDAGSLSSLAPTQCIAQFFLGEKAQAEETYTQFSNIVYQALGSEFVYCYDKPMELMSQVIPGSAENVMFFAIKRERAGESIPVIALVNQKQADGRYLIYLNFYKTVY